MYKTAVKPISIRLALSPRYVQRNISPALSTEATKSCWETCWLFQRPGKCNYPFRPMLQTPIYGMVNNSQEDSIYVDDVSAEKREKGLQRLARSLMP
jgi:hypothetical protein